MNRPTETASELSDEQLDALIRGRNGRTKGFDGWTYRDIMRDAIYADRAIRQETTSAAPAEPNVIGWVNPAPNASVPMAPTGITRTVQIGVATPITPSAAPREAERNQCDGCNIGAPINSWGHHVYKDGSRMACTSGKYGLVERAPRGELTEAINDLMEIHAKVAKISGSALLAGEKHGKDDKTIIYGLACELLGEVGYVMSTLEKLRALASNPTSSGDPDFPWKSVEALALEAALWIESDECKDKAVGLCRDIRAAVAARATKDQS